MSWKLAAIIAVGVAFLTLTSAVSARDRTLRQHYGNAIGEVYRTPNHLTVTAFFGARGNICLERIESEITGRRLTDKEVNSVLDDIAPKNDRGNFKRGGFHNLGDPENNSNGYGTFEDYDRLTITKDGPDNEYRYVFIFYNSVECWQMDADKH